MGAKFAIESPESEGVIAQMVAQFQERRDLMVAGLNAIDGIQCQNPRGAFYVFPNISGACENVGAMEAYQSLADETQAKTSPATRLRTASMRPSITWARGDDGADRIPKRAVGHRFDVHGLPVEMIHGPYAQMALGQREYALLQRVWCPGPEECS